LAFCIDCRIALMKLCFKDRSNDIVFSSIISTTLNRDA
jgi:hypothetical protein